MYRSVSKDSLGFKLQCWSKETQLWIKNFSCPPLMEGAQLWTQSNIPPSKLIYLFQGAHKKFMDQSCVSFDQHCILAQYTPVAVLVIAGSSASVPACRDRSEAYDKYVPWYWHLVLLPDFQSISAVNPLSNTCALHCNLPHISALLIDLWTWWTRPGCIDECSAMHKWRYLSWG